MRTPKAPSMTKLYDVGNEEPLESIARQNVLGSNYAHTEHMKWTEQVCHSVHRSISRREIQYGLLLGHATALHRCGYGRGERHYQIPFDEPLCAEWLMDYWFQAVPNCDLNNDYGPPSQRGVDASDSHVVRPTDLKADPSSDAAAAITDDELRSPGLEDETKYKPNTADGPRGLSESILRSNEANYVASSSSASLPFEGAKQSPQALACTPQSGTQGPPGDTIFDKRALLPNSDSDSQNSPYELSGEESEDDLVIEGMPTTKIKTILEPHSFFLPKEDKLKLRQIYNKLLAQLAMTHIPTKKKVSKGRPETRRLGTEATDRVVKFFYEMSGQTGKENFDQWRRWFTSLDTKYMCQNGQQLNPSQATAIGVVMDVSGSRDSHDGNIAKPISATEDPLESGSYAWKQLTVGHRPPFQRRFEHFQAQSDLWIAIRSLEEKADIVNSWGPDEKHNLHVQEPALQNLYNQLQGLDNRTLQSKLNTIWSGRFGVGVKKFKTVRAKARAIWEFTELFGRSSWILLPESASTRLVHSLTTVMSMSANSLP